MYAALEREAKEAGLRLHWPARLPNTRQALTAAEWVRRNQPSGFSQLHRELFEAHFVLCENLEDIAVIDRHARNSAIDLVALHAALEDGSAANFVSETETIGRRPQIWGSRYACLALGPAINYGTSTDRRI
jgi:predicted DsbA family dithiol-disulfide isomerase